MGDLGNQNSFLLLATPEVGVDGEKVLHASLLKVNQSYKHVPKEIRKLFSKLMSKIKFMGSLL